MKTDNPHVFIPNKGQTACVKCHLLVPYATEVGPTCVACLNAERKDEQRGLMCEPNECYLVDCPNANVWTRCSICDGVEDEKHLDPASIVLRRGSIVYDRTASQLARRGIVTWTPACAKAHLAAKEAGKPSRYPPSVPMLGADDYVISQDGGGTSSVTNNLEGKWVEVDWELTTPLERVRSVSMTYERPTWYDEDEFPESEEREYELLGAILPPSMLGDFMEWGDSYSYDNLAYEVAKWIGESEETRENRFQERRDELEIEFRDRKKELEDELMAAIQWFKDAVAVKEMRDNMPIPLMQLMVEVEASREPF